ncbi:MAG TPA: cytochrome P450, partial [Spongiibacteraceae bacterium]|nr:cytochrome P450 [Spongiibacteraceae bacterium]
MLPQGTAHTESCMATSPETGVHFDPYAHEVHDDPYPYYAKMREQAPVYYNRKHGYWLLTKWDDCQAAFRDFRTFSSAAGPALEANQDVNAGYPMFINMDPPQHTRIRKLIQALMLPQRIAELEPYIREKAVSLLTPHLKSGRMDLTQDFAALLPMDVISTMIHVPVEDQNQVRQWADDLIFREDGQFGLNERNITAYLSMGSYFDKLATELSGKLAGDDDIFSAILQAEREGKLSHDDVIGFGILLAIAGNETTTKLIGNMCYRLWQHKDQRQLLIDDPQKIANGVEETLRFDGSTQMIGRQVMQDVEIRGNTIKAGERVGLCIISASRDEGRYENAESYDVTRGARDHMAFGSGVHSCVGSALARLEVRVCMEELLRLIPDYEIDEAGLERTHNPNVRGFTHVPV